MPKKSLLYVYFGLFTLSGFSGLIYESVWSHYLKLFLGHAAYAQTLVLIIFMGGMAVGAALAAKYSAKATNLILLYAIAEGIVGLFGVFFHPLFTTVSDLTFSHIIPALDSPLAVETAKWLIAALLIMPQSIILGTTFVLLATGIIRKFGELGGKNLATLYFSNSLGAAVGVLANVYYFIPNAGLPGSAVIAGMFNLLLALAVWLSCRRDHYPLITKAVAAVKRIDLKIYLWVAAITGTASFIYEIVWIRMLSMVLGASTHAFEIMLSAFILGLALGSWWIRKRIGQFASPLKALAIIQLLMGCLALLTLPLYSHSFDLMVFFSTSLATTDNGYILFNVISYLICLFLMLPTTICAGMTLPLLTHLLIRDSGHDNSVGKIYTANTIGAIVGIILASQLLMPLLGMKYALIIGAGLDVMLGLYLFIRAADTVKTMPWRHKAALALPVILLLVAIPQFNLDPVKMSSSVFRSGRYLNPDISEVVYYVDGKTSTVTMTEIQTNAGQVLSIINNGKPDASIRYQSDGKTLIPTDDEPTMILLGALPYLLHPNIEQVANIGLGSGLTAQTLLQHPGLKRLDSIEIEAAVVEGAKRFGARVDKVYNDPRSHIIIDDAKTYFVSNKKQYDAIVSEPPNPWVSGVSSLFSAEFYQLIEQYLTDQGLFVQWMHLYELNPRLLQSIYTALRGSFDHVQIYQISTVDIALVASNSTIPPLRAEVFNQPELAGYLNYIDVKNIDDIIARRLGSEPLLDDYLMHESVKENSDYFPVLDFGAIKARYLRQSAKVLFQLHDARLAQSLHQQDKLAQQVTLSENRNFPYAAKYNNSQRFYQAWQALNRGKEMQQPYDFGIYSRVLQLQQLLSGCDSSDHNRQLNSDLIKLLTVTDFYWLHKTQLRDIYGQLSQPQCQDAITPAGRHIVASVLAFTESDVTALKHHSNAYLEAQSRLSSAADFKMLKFYLYAALLLDDKGRFDEFLARTTSEFQQDVEYQLLNNRYLARFYPDPIERMLRTFSVNLANRTID